MLKRLQDLDPTRFQTPEIYKALVAASRALAALNGEVEGIPNHAVLLNTLGIQEAKDSSAIENIVTTHDDLYREEAFPSMASGLAAKEVHRYREALLAGYHQVRKSGLVTTNDLVRVASELLATDTAVRTMPGTVLRNDAGETVYTPPQDPAEVLEHLKALEEFINDGSAFDADPIVKMALIHHQFESIHPFRDGNGRTGRILNVLYLVKEDLLRLPVLYLSKPIVQSKGDYYLKLNGVRVQDDWEQWVLYMLQMVNVSALEARLTVERIKTALITTKHQIREQHKFYSQDLINNLFSHPYTKIEFVMQDLKVTRLTATRYLDALTKSGVLRMQKVGRSNYYINTALYEVLSGHA